MRIGVITLPLHYNIGGILQAYALQEVLRRMGHSAQLINIGASSYHIHPLLYYPTVATWYLKYIIKQTVSLGENIPVYKHIIQTENVSDFISKHIEIFSVNNRTEINESSFDAFVVGSDQIWRPSYNDRIEESYLSFTEGWDVKRVAYAPSFGVDVWEYSDVQASLCRKFIQNFNAISVREDSGVVLCRTHFNVESECLLDPTLLLKSSDYVGLLNPLKSKTTGCLFTYVLDSNKDKVSVIDDMVVSYKIKKMSSIESNKFNWFKANSESKVEKWIRGIYEAEIVFTDSFHGCVFCILFHKEFVAFGNKERGLSRFQSLLKLFDLEDRVVTSYDEYKERKMRPIDWEKIDDKLQELREKSFSFLTKSLL